MAIKLQKPQIIKITGSTIKVAHPDVSQYTRTYVASPHTAAATALVVADNNNYANTDYLILGELGDAKTEESQVNASVTRGTAITIVNTTKFDHELDAPVTRIFERQVQLYGATSTSDSGTLINTVNIQWDKPFTEITNTGTLYSYYFVRFYDGTTQSAVSTYALATGLPKSSAAEIIWAALELCKERYSAVLPVPIMVRFVDDWQNSVTELKQWSWEMVKDESSIAVTTNENKFSMSSLDYEIKHDNNMAAIHSVRLGTNVLVPIDLSEYDDLFAGKPHAFLASGVSVGATSVTLDDSAEFSETGTFTLGADTVTYTANDQTTGVLSGIPASGSGSITAIGATGASVWQSISSGLPDKYTVFETDFLLNRPVSASYNGQKLKVRYLKKLPEIDDLQDETEIPFPDIARYYVASRIELRKNNKEEAGSWLSIYNSKLKSRAQNDKLIAMEETVYYNFEQIG